MRVAVVFAPGYRTGYAGNAFPALWDAIQKHNWAQAQQQVDALVAAITAAAAYLNELAPLAQAR